MRSSTETLIAACRELAATVQCDDGVANEALREIAERLEELAGIKSKRDEALRALRECEGEWVSWGMVERLIEEIE
jgi:hypothetical protein